MPKKNQVKIGIQTWGSDDDILPFIALAEGLQAADHEVTFAYSSVDNKDYSSYADMGNFSVFKVFERYRLYLVRSSLGAIITMPPVVSNVI